MTEKISRKTSIHAGFKSIAGPTNSIQKVRRDKAKNALIETKISLEIASREIGKFIDEFQIAKSDQEKANVINQCIRYLAQNCMSNLQLSQLANCQSELINFDQ